MEGCELLQPLWTFPSADRIAERGLSLERGGRRFASCRQAARRGGARGPARPEKIKKADSRRLDLAPKYYYHLASTLKLYVHPPREILLAILLVFLARLLARLDCRDCALVALDGTWILRAFLDNGRTLYFQQKGFSMNYMICDENSWKLLRETYAPENPWFMLAGVVGTASKGETIIPLPHGTL